MTDYLVFTPIGYLLGSLPFGLIATRLVKRVDVRDFGSGGTGMTNVIRTAGVKVGVVVLALDMGKAVVAVALARGLADSPGAEAAAGLAALVAHIWPIFGRFRGGKGTAPGWGGLFMLCPLCGLAATAVGLPLVIITRYVSVGSLLGASSGAILLIILAAVGVQPFEHMWYGIIGVVLVVGRHKDNVERLMKGEERRLGKPGELIRGETKDPTAQGSP